MTRTPLITNVSDSILNRQKNTILSAYAIGKVFTGATLSALDLDLYVEQGMVRIDDTATHGPSHVDLNGFLNVIALDRDDDTSTNSETYLIRQIFYPDNSDYNVQTRTGSGSSASVMLWSDWSEMGGGGFLKRIELTEDMTGVGEDVAQANVMYYSYHNYTLHLPDPNNYRLGTRIGLEQIANDVDASGIPAGSGYVKYESTEQTTYADYKVELVEDEIVVTDELIGSVIYYFTVAEDSEGSQDKTWVLEIAGDLRGLILEVNSKIALHMADLDDPHTQYLKHTDLENAISDSTDTAITPKAVQDALSGVGEVNLDGYVTKEDLYIDGSNTVKRNKILTATNLAVGTVRVAKDDELYGSSNLDAWVVPSSAQTRNRRLIHSNTYTTNEVSVISEEDLAKQNPMFTIGAANRTIQLPTPTAAMVARVATVYIDLVHLGSAKSEVTVESGDLSETFTNDKPHSTIQLVFEASHNTVNTYIWKLVL